MRCAALLFGFLSGLTVYAQPTYDYRNIQRERLGRGLVVVRDEKADSLVLSWRYLKEDAPQTSFNVYCDGHRLNANPLTNATFFKIPPRGIGDSSVFEVRSELNGVETKSAAVAANLRHAYVSIPLKLPQNGTTPDGRTYGYRANDASVGDVDGDGEYEIILKWEPTNAHDNAHAGYTGNVYLDCYRLTGEQLWRIDLGRNIRAGAHYTQFMVYDFDGDGKAELMAKTADGTRDGIGHCIGDSTADYRFHGDAAADSGRPPLRRNDARVGRVLSGPEYLTVFDGLTGRALESADYIPQRGDIGAWGDDYGNRVDRFLACVAYLDGTHASAVMCRGYYTRSVLAAWDWDGKNLKQRWVFDTDDERWRSYAGQGNHNLRVADVDGDGCDEIIYGSMAVDHDGTGLYNTGLGHGDAMHLTCFHPDSTTLQVWGVHENKRDGSVLRDARTGRILHQIPSQRDVGRGMAADIDPTHRGVEMWSSDSHGIRNACGEVIAANARIPINSAVWWDGDLLREMLDHCQVSKYDWQTQTCRVVEDFQAECTFNNGSKSNPCLSADLLGDWREEIVVATKDSRELRIYTTTIPTARRFPTFMEDIPYRLSVATENVGYNQPPQPGFYFGEQ